MSETKLHDLKRKLRGRHWLLASFFEVDYFRGNTNFADVSEFLSLEKHGGVHYHGLQHFGTCFALDMRKQNANAKRN